VYVLIILVACCRQPSSERSAPDEPADHDEADVPDQLTKEDMGDLSGQPSTMEAGTSDQAFTEAKSTTSDAQPAQAPQQELIDANDVLKALKAFVEERNKHRVRHVVLFFYYYF